MALGEASVFARLSLASLVLMPVVLAPTALAATAPERAWQREAALMDARYSGAFDMGPAVRAGAARMVLPFPAILEGGRYESIEIRAGSILFLAGGAQAMVDVDGRVTPSDVSPPRSLDVLSGPALRLGAGPVLVLATEEGLAVRWADLRGPSGGRAVVEALVNRLGTVTMQWLDIPSDIEKLVQQGLIRSGLDGPVGSRGLGAPADATAFSLAQRLINLTPVHPGPIVPSNPSESGPPPPGCDPRPQSWCEQADGPNDTQIYLLENFDDGDSESRGWGPDPDPPNLPIGTWHDIAFAQCAPGALTNPGVSWYCGQNATCSYTDNLDAMLSGPAVGPIVAGTQWTFSLRLSKELAPADLAGIWINTGLMWTIDDLPDPNGWYNINPLDLTAFTGQMVRVKFRFTSDFSVTDIGWFVDDVRMWATNGANSGCVLSAGTTGASGPLTPCSTRVADEWHFNEGAFCADCLYTFYALVECGREMHLPLSDMEGGDITVTDVLNGVPASLHCVNQTANAMAGLEPFPGFLIPDGVGGALMCCGDTSPTAFWGPPFDETDTSGPGRVQWGQPDCNAYDVYDADANNLVTCAELSPTCSGQLDLLSPGENQAMDCYIANDTGLCGIYRIDIRSGGFDWRLFANCDGSTTPQFQIFQDCTEAWTAFTPLPEIAVANLVTVGVCPNVQVDFDLVNIGCEDHAGPTLVRITDNCVPQGPSDTLDLVVIDPIPAGGSTHISTAFTPTCQPVRIEVAADPDNTIAECTESLTIAACRQDEGVNSLATFTCGCTAQLTADAGPDQFACNLEFVHLDGRGSSIAPCTTPLYRWIDDATGGTIDTLPETDVLFTGCPGTKTYTLEVSCSGEVCVHANQVTITCLVPNADAGPDTKVCVGGNVTLSAAASTVPGCAQLQYKWYQPGGGIAQDWSTNPDLLVASLTCARAGIYRAEVRCATGGTCSDSDTVRLDCVQVLSNAGADQSVCEGDAFSILDAGSTATNCSTMLYQWADLAGTPLTGVLTDPDITIPGLAGCPGVLTLALVAVCGEPGFETCGTVDFIDIACPKPAAPVPVSVDRCDGPSADLACGVAPPEAGVTYWWDLDTSVDADGNTVLDDDRDVTGCDAVGVWPAAGSRTVRAGATESVAGCTSTADFLVEVFVDPTLPVPAACAGLPGEITSLTCGIIPPEPGVTYSWDFDTAVDADGNTVADDDADASGCDATTTYAAGTRTARVSATDGRCTVTADLAVDVNVANAPPEVQGLRVSRVAAALTVSWTAEPSALTYRVLRGSLVPGLWTNRAYDHAADDTAGVGKCDTGLVTSWTDPDDATDSLKSYYLVTAVDGCGSEGTPGSDSLGIAHPRRIASASCP